LSPSASGVAAEKREERIEERGEMSDFHLLRSTNDVVGHEAMASDAPIGRIQSLLFDDESRAIRHLMVETSGGLPGKRVRSRGARREFNDRQRGVQ